MNEKIAELSLLLRGLGCVKFGKFTLKSGVESPIYIDLRLLVSSPGLLAKVAHSMRDLAESRNLSFDRIGGVPLAGLPIATALALETNFPMVYPRDVKDHGTMQSIEGKYEKGETVVVVDDLITDGGSKIKSIEVLEAAGLKVTDVLVLIDREQGGAEDLASRGYTLHAVMTLKQVLEALREEKQITEEQYSEVMSYLSAK